MRQLALILALVSLLFISGCYENNSDRADYYQEQYEKLYDDTDEIWKRSFQLEEENRELEKELVLTRATLINFVMLCDEYGIEWYNEIETYVICDY